MKTFTFSLSFLFAVTVLQAQDYQISFTGTGQSTSVDSIQVKNLTQGTILSLSGDDVLHLVGNLGINTLTDNENTIKIYPNPMVESAFVEFANSKTELVYIEIYNGMGALIAKQNTQVQNGKQRFEISGLKAGIYTFNVNAADWKYAAKLISLRNNQGNTAIKHRSTDEGPTPESALKSTIDLVEMQYNDGEIILFKGFTGNYARVLTLLPTQSQTVNFEFIPCLDEDGNNYAVVTIGTQIWMAENLTTTKYNDGTDIPLITDNDAWAALTTPGFCWFNNDQSTYGSTYGALYNWHTVNTANLCPTDWHVPTDDEWTTLTTYLGFEFVAGGKLKEAGLAHWISPNTGATNETGFTALPGGKRWYNDPCSGLGWRGWWWSATEWLTDFGLVREMRRDSDRVYSGGWMKSTGISVRCLRD